MYFKKSFGPNLQIVCLKDCVWSWCMYIYYTYTCLFWCSTFWWHNSRNLQCFISELLEMTAKPGPAEIYWNSFRSSKFGKLSKLGRFSETLCRFAVNVWANWTEPIGYLSVFDTIHSEHNIISDTPWSNLGKYEGQEIYQGPREISRSEGNAFPNASLCSLLFSIQWQYNPRHYLWKVKWHQIKRGILCFFPQRFCNKYIKINEF